MLLRRALLFAHSLSFLLLCVLGVGVMRIRLSFSLPIFSLFSLPVTFFSHTIRFQPSLCSATIYLQTIIYIYQRYSHVYLTLPNTSTLAVIDNIHLRTHVPNLTTTSHHSALLIPHPISTISHMNHDKTSSLTLFFPFILPYFHSFNRPMI